MDPARYCRNICNTPDVKIAPHSQAVDVAPRLASSAVRQHTRPIPLPLCRGSTVIHPSGIRRACACFLHLLKVLGYRTMQLIARLWSLPSSLRAVQHNDQISEGPHNTVPFKGCNAEFTTTAFLSGTDLHAIESPNSRICSSIQRISASSSAGRAAQHGPSIRHRKMLSWISDQGPNSFKKKATNCCVQTHQQDPHEAKL